MKLGHRLRAFPLAQAARAEIGQTQRQAGRPATDLQRMQQPGHREPTPAADTVGTCSDVSGIETHMASTRCGATFTPVAEQLGRDSPVRRCAIAPPSSAHDSRGNARERTFPTKNGVRFTLQDSGSSLVLPHAPYPTTSVDEAPLSMSRKSTWRRSVRRNRLALAAQSRSLRARCQRCPCCSDVARAWACLCVALANTRTSAKSWSANSASRTLVVSPNDIAILTT